MQTLERSLHLCFNLGSPENFYYNHERDISCDLYENLEHNFDACLDASLTGALNRTLNLSLGRNFLGEVATGSRLAGLDRSKDE